MVDITTPSQLAALEEQLMTEQNSITEQATYEGKIAEAKTIIDHMKIIEIAAKQVEYKEGVPAAHKFLTKAYIEGIKDNRGDVPPLYAATEKVYRELAEVYVEYSNEGDEEKMNEIIGYMSQLREIYGRNRLILEEILENDAQSLINAAEAIREVYRARQPLRNPEEVATDIRNA